ncbi:MAG: esterase [Piscirickettsiaceae bacterium]|nr:MAG: esterase [Piscirickettsiaceae bacterium]
MALNESTLNFLNLVAESGAKSFHEGTPDEAREAIDLLMSMGPKGAENVTIKDYVLPESSVTLRVIEPKTKVTSIIVYYHGGGWVCGSIAAYETVARQLAVTASAVVVLVDYRLAPEYPYPIPVDDCWAGLLWVDANRDKFNGKKLPLVVSGDSAGGNLAAIMAKRSTVQGPHITAQALIYPATGIDLETPSCLSEENQLLLKRDDMVWFWNHYVGTTADRSDPEMAPVLAKNLSKIAPTLVITAEHDVLRDDGKLYADKLLEAGVDVQYLDASGETHGFMCLYGVLPSCQWAIESIASFVRAKI